MGQRIMYPTVSSCASVNGGCTKPGAWMKVQCFLCGTVKRLDLPHTLTDDEAELIFAEHGWTVRLTACADCIGWLM